MDDADIANAVAVNVAPASIEGAQAGNEADKKSKYSGAVLIGTYVARPLLVLGLLYVGYRIAKR